MAIDFFQWFDSAFFFVSFSVSQASSPLSISISVYIVFLSWRRTNSVSLCHYIFLNPFVCIFTTLFSSFLSEQQAWPFF